MVKPLIQISFLLTLSACNFDNEHRELANKTNQNNLAECYNHFRDCAKRTELKNCSMQFGSFLETGNEFGVLEFTNKDGIGYLPKGAFQVMDGQDSTMVFIYGVANSRDSILKEIRVRSFKSRFLESDEILLSPESSLIIDYLHFPPNELRTSRTKPDGRQNVGMFRFEADGSIHHHSPMSDSTFAMLTNSYSPGQKKVRIFNQFTDKRYIGANGLGVVLEGKVMKYLGGKGVRRSILVELDDNPLFDEKYALIGVDIYHVSSLPLLPTTMSLTNSNKTKAEEGPVGSQITELVGSIKPIEGYIYLE